MTDSAPGSASIPWRSSTVQVVLVTVILALAGVLLVAPSLGRSSASAMLGLVLVEAIVLYVGYGAVTRVASQAVHRSLTSD